VRELPVASELHWALLGWTTTIASVLASGR
jgi:hypothetical protein